MLHVYHRLSDLNFVKLMDLYSEGNKENAQAHYPASDRYTALFNVEQDFYQYLLEIFFPTKGAFYAVWEENGAYLSALRMEPYRNGLLLAALETHPDYRRSGYAKALISSTLKQLEQTGVSFVYAHVHKRNEASLRSHLSCGFTRVSEQAVYIDGSVNTRYCTLQYQF